MNKCSRSLLGIGARTDTAEAVVIDSHGGCWAISELLLHQADHRLVTITELIANWTQFRLACIAALDRISELGVSPSREHHLGPPACPSTKVICAIDNYTEHADEFATEVFPKPIFFLKPYTALLEHNGTIVLPKQARRVDYELELAVVIGQRCRNLSSHEAPNAIFGYTTFIDMSARDFRSIPYTWFAVKAWDTFGPLGPYIVPADAIPNPSSLEMSLYVNGEKRMSGNTNRMIFSPADLVAAASEVATLQPGDIIATGTIAGVGPAATGDAVEATIGNLGVLSVRVKTADETTVWHDQDFPKLYSQFRAESTSDNGADLIAPPTRED